MQHTDVVRLQDKELNVLEEPVDAVVLKMRRPLRGSQDRVQPAAGTPQGDPGHAGWTIYPISLRSMSG